jgi:5-methylcytosine-specific restriction endonuclease McrA
MRKTENPKQKKNPKVEVKCIVCGKYFLVYPYRIKTAKYCSTKCHGEWLSKTRVKENVWNWIGGKIEKVCAVCGGKFWVHRCHDRRRARKCCSLKCGGILQRGLRSGNKNNKWKGGITPTMEKIRKMWQYTDWRKRVYVRDNYTCVSCGQIGGRLNAHHIKRFSYIIDVVWNRFPLLPIMDIIENHPEMWDVDNGKTLCKICHKKEHDNGHYKQTQSARITSQICNERQVYWPEIK